jgi:magnesium chelatase family protein
MRVATACSIALVGAEGHLIDVQVAVSKGVVGTFVVGRPDASLHEARDRVRMAINNSAPTPDDTWPATFRVTILLAPADLPKSGTHFDLAIAVGVRAACGAVPAASLHATVFIGELSLSGSLRPVAGVLPMVIAAAARGIRRVFVPESQAAEAAMVPGMEVLGMRSLAQVVAELNGEEVPDAAPVAGPVRTSLLPPRRGAVEPLDLDDLDGMEDAKYALEVAAAGGHHLMLNGPRGAGKTSLAERLPTILPDLTTEQALEVTALHSLAGLLRDGDGLVHRPPYFAPHHDASKASVVGGGTGRVRPGGISRAHHGVLFLDEFPLFRADVVDALRQPLESGEITLARGEESATFPARSMVVLAANPCPCGNFSASVTTACTCLEPARHAYRRKLVGPIVDRIDIWRDVEPVSAEAAHDRFAPRVDSATVRSRVERARATQAERYAGRSWLLNGVVPGPVLAREWPLELDGQRLLDDRLRDGSLTRRGVTRVQRLAWTVADLRGVARPGPSEVGLALRLRTAEPLSSDDLRMAG